jgi:arylformamidase
MLPTPLGCDMDEWINLTQELTETMPVRSRHPQPRFEGNATLEEDGYNSTVLHVETHCGTHMDAPTHFLAPERGRTIDQVTTSEMVTEGVICDFRDKKSGAAVTRDELVSEAEKYDLSSGDYLIWDCGMSPEDGDQYLRNFVYPKTGAAEYMVETDITCFAIDALSADKPDASLAEHHVHELLLHNDVLILEGVAHLEQVPPGRYDVICTPLPYDGRDGSQARVLVRPQ